jgi:hypothetical protein
MPRRRRRANAVTLFAVLLVGAVLGAVALSVFLRAREPGAPPGGTADLRVEVLNGCGMERVADRVASLLRRGGFRVENVGNADHFHYHQDIVVARTVSRDRAEVVGRWLDGAIVIEQRTPGYPYDVSVIVGKPHSLVDEP